MRTLKSFIADNEYVLTDQINMYAKGNELRIVSLQTHALEKEGKMSFSAFVLFEWTEEAEA